MFVTDSFVYIQMQKTGCTHIASLLNEIFEGQQIGKHNALAPSELLPNRIVISSIRNPWDWYLSLWLYGVAGKGGFMHRLTNLKLMGSKQREVWRNLYSSDDINLYRQWLKLIHSSDIGVELDDEYGNTFALSDSLGFMRYRYLRLCWKHGVAKWRPSLDNFDDLHAYDSNLCFIDFFIRQESLETDLINICTEIRLLTSFEEEIIKNAGRTNASTRDYKIEEYYDQESIDLIMHRDQLIVKKFNYRPPIICESQAVRAN